MHPLIILQEISKKWKLRLVLDSINFTDDKNIENFSGKLYLTRR